MRKNKLFLIAALVFAAAQLPALGARAEYTAQEQAAIQPVIDSFEAVAGQLQTAINDNAVNQMTNSQNPLVSGLGNGINDAQTPAEVQEAVDDFVDGANDLANSGAAQFMTDEAQAELGDAMAAAMSPGDLQAAATELAQLQAALDGINDTIKRMKSGFPAEEEAEQVGLNDANPRDRQDNRTAYLAGLGSRIARGQTRVNHPLVPYHPPRVEVPR